MTPQADKMFISPDATALARHLAQDLAHHIQVQAERRSDETPVEIAIAGGFVATHVLPALGEEGQGVDWRRFVSGGVTNVLSLQVILIVTMRKLADTFLTILMVSALFRCQAMKDKVFLLRA